MLGYQALQKYLRNLVDKYFRTIKRLTPELFFFYFSTPVYKM